MADEGFKRKLTAILSADVKDYSRLMEDDEAETVRTLNTYRTAISDLIQKYRGRVVDATGDNIMAEYSSVVDAVNCAVEIQRDLAERNEELTYERRMEFRIGVNLGDVIDEDGHIYGDGVNIAARVENLAEPGGICISGRVYDQVANKLGLEYENLGEHQVKNISTPIRVYRVLSFPGAAAHRVVQAKEAVKKKWRNLATAAAAVVLVVVISAGIWSFYHGQSMKVEAASIENMAYPLPEDPSIAVLPFTNMSGDPKQDYLGDAISENIISSLAMLSSLFVISSNSTFVYKDKPVKIRQVSEELGVQYVLEGSVMKSKDQVRVTVQLIDALTGRHKWSQKYDGRIQDFLQMLDEITKKVCTELNVQLGVGESSRFWHKGTDNFEAWECVTRAYGLRSRLKREDLMMANELTERAISIDPEYSYAWAFLARNHFLDARYGWGESRTESIKKCVEYINKALSLDESNHLAYITRGQYYMMQKKFDMAIVELETECVNENETHTLIN
jgi:TolB-like protein/class 3 adenylate cyclase